MQAIGNRTGSRRCDARLTQDNDHAPGSSRPVNAPLRQTRVYLGGVSGTHPRVPMDAERLQARATTAEAQVLAESPPKADAAS